MTRPMRVGILSQWYDPEPGPASIPGVLVRGLIERGHQVRVVTGQPNYPVGKVYPGYRAMRRSRKLVDGADVVRVPLYPSHDSSIVLRSLNYLSFAVSAFVLGVWHLRRCDVVWVYNSPPTVLLPMLAVRQILRRPVVLHVMDIWPESLRATGFAPSGRASSAVYRVVDAVCRAMYRASAEILYISPSVGEVLEGRGVPRERLSYVPAWTDESVFLAGAGSDRSRGRAQGEPLTLLYAGAIGRAQGLDLLIEAFAQLRDVPARLVLAGEGTEREALTARAERLGLENVTFLGAVPKDRIGDVMQAADVHVISLQPTALGNMSLPSKLQATMAGAYPILAIAEGDLAQVIRASGAGIVVDPSDPAALIEAITRLAGADRGELDRMGRAAARYYEEEFASATGVERTERALRAALLTDARK